MAESEVFQTRLDPPEAEAVHEYREERSISKAEATRRLVAAGLEKVEEEAEEAEEAEGDQAEERARPTLSQVLAPLGEKLAWGSLLVLFLSSLPSLAVGLAMDGGFEPAINVVLAVLTVFLGGFLLSGVMLVISVLLLAYLLATEGREAIAGWFGRRVRSVVNLGAREVQA
jgi:hypothetical protein